MTESEDRLREARSRARTALQSPSGETLRNYAGAWVGGVLIGGGVLASMVPEMLSAQLAWKLLLVGSLVGAGTMAFLFQLIRLAERSDALRDLYAADRDYHVLLDSAWRELQQAKLAITELTMMRRLQSSSGESSSDEGDKHVAGRA